MEDSFDLFALDGMLGVAGHQSRGYQLLRPVASHWFMTRLGLARSLVWLTGPAIIQAICAGQLRAEQDLPCSAQAFHFTAAMRTPKGGRVTLASETGDCWPARETSSRPEPPMTP